MKIKSITPMKDREDKDLWRIDFEGNALPMWTGFEPKSKVGDTIDDDRLQKSRSGKSWIFKKKGKDETGVSQSRGRPPDERASIERQSARRDAGEMYRHYMPKDQPFNEKEFAYLMEFMQKIVDPVVLEAIKKGGQIKK